LIEIVARLRTPVSYNLLAEMNESTVWGPLVDVFRTKILEINKESIIKNIQLIFRNTETNFQVYSFNH